MSDFMQRQVTGLENWLRVETSHGTFWLEGGTVFVRNSEQISQPLTEDEREQYSDAIRDYVEGTPQTWENVRGYGARLSAPGYLDCTEWCVFDTEQAAIDYLDEYYPEDENTEDTEDDGPARVWCSQCEASMINGVFCHETGCPNSGSRYDADSDTWIKQRKCFECGCTVDADDPCCSEPSED